jgi:NAD(P)-dependent dehydrogenase (short-subunit alcohol dehydrogenase family)
MIGPHMANESNKNPETLLGSGQRGRRENGSYVVVTGASGGIGLPIVRRLRRDGWSVLATDFSNELVDQMLDEFGGDSKVDLTVMNVAKRESIDAVARQLSAKSASVSGLVNVAGLLQDVKPLLGFDADAQRKIWDVNYFGAEQCIQVFAPMMEKIGGGAIVNITSINEIRPLPLHAYAPSKVALGALTALAAGDLGRLGIRVNAVAPGFTLTPAMQSKFDSGARTADLVISHTALRRLVSIDEVAAAVSFLLSDDASAITGISLPVDAGWLATSHWMNMSAILEQSTQQINER